MTVIVCVDDRGGMRFHGRRQSRDRLLCADVLRLCGRVRMNAASAALFEGLDGQLLVSEAFCTGPTLGMPALWRTVPSRVWRSTP